MSIVLQNIFLIMGGLGLFLFGMKIMSDGLERIAGDKMRKILEKATSNRYLGIIVGIIVTIIINSSSAVTIMTVGFVNSGLMNLSQALSIILGANIGTTVSAQLIAFKIDHIAPLCIFIGVVMNMFFKKRDIQNIGYIILGFGILFFGIYVMGVPMEDFSKSPSFQSLLILFQNPFLALLAGLLFTAIIQSSSASIGILVALYLRGVSFPFESAAFIILGCNLGTVTDALISSIPANRQAKQAAVSHAIFNVLSVIIFGLLLLTFPIILTKFQEILPDGARQVAMFHTIYNISAVLLLLPFFKPYVKLIERILPIKSNEESLYTKKLLYLDKNFTNTPSLLIVNADLEFSRMGKIAHNNLKFALASFFEKDLQKTEETLKNEKIINFLNQNITIQLAKFNNLVLSNKDATKISKMFKILSDVERIGDHAENIAKYSLIIKNDDLKFSDIALKELKILSDNVIKLIALALKVYEKQDHLKLTQIKSLEQKVDRLSQEFIENHINRFKTNNCDPKSGVIFHDIIIDLERCADHAKNIAYSIKDKNKSS